MGNYCSEQSITCAVNSVFLSLNAEPSGKRYGNPVAFNGLMCLRRSHSSTWSRQQHNGTGTSTRSEHWGSHLAILCLILLPCKTKPIEENACHTIVVAMVMDCAQCCAALSQTNFF